MGAMTVLIRSIRPPLARPARSLIDHPGCWGTSKLLRHLDRRHLARCQHRLGSPDIGLIQSWWTTAATTAFCHSLKPGAGPLNDELAFHRTQCAEDVEYEPAAPRRGARNLGVEYGHAVSLCRVQGVPAELAHSLRQSKCG